MASTRPTHYPSLIIGFHWLVAALVLAAFALVFVAEELGDKSLKGTLITLHKSIGISVLFIMVLRIMMTLTIVRPAAAPGPRALRIVAQSVHWAFYGLLIAIPFLGWWMSSAAGKPINWFFLFEVPSVAALDMPFAKELKEWHEELGEILLVLVGLHAGAALWHHYVKKDNTLQRMLPKKKSP
ncbi:cytochrome b [Perlucidibaca aquatica]|uniref:cytochrome b n=1 Tax=Perlucidibaca aquatica TaxID=1852776 RepID=UPI00083AB644|nr:cytochrome b [Perlucidibaca aquatica]